MILKQKLQGDEEFDRQAAYDDLERLNDELDDSYEEILDEILPEAYAVVNQPVQGLVGTTWTVAGNKTSLEYGSL
jgi:preprotein translocase subunit SecA